MKAILCLACGSAEVESLAKNESDHSLSPLIAQFYTKEKYRWPNVSVFGQPDRQAKTIKVTYSISRQDRVSEPINLFSADRPVTN